ncbi:MAG: acetate--CoA ligase family protein [Solirubrobacterales bacterium]|nr:acetate--CoA ligase family protein [Solirubrobacterales bacterium]
MSGLERVFAPRRVAVVGASDQDGKVGTSFMRNLEGFTGEVVPINPSRDEVLGHRAYARLADAPDRIDLAVAIVPAKAILEVVADAAAADVGALVVVSGGFAETGDAGAELQRRVVQAGRAGGVRIVGPNCLGVQNAHLGLNATMALGTGATAGAITLATQSGAYGMAIYMLGQEQQMNFAKLYAAGNRCDIRDAEVLEYLGGDAESEVLCFLIESMPDGRDFCEAVREIAPRKPVIVTKTGRTAAGLRAAASHTAALAGNAELWRAALEQSGAIVADSGLEMLDLARALDWQPVPRGGRVGVVTNSGGVGVELTDLLTEGGLTVPELSSELQADLADRLPAVGSPRNPVDVTTAWAKFAELYPYASDRLARSGEVDIVVTVLLARSAQDRAVAEGMREVSRRLATDGIEVPLYICWVAPADARPNLELLQAAGVPCYEWPVRAARAASLAHRYGRVRHSRDERAQAAPAPEGLPEVGEGPLDGAAAAELARAFGIDVAPQAIASDAEAAARAAERIGFPVVAKLVSRTQIHKSEVGGVHVDLAGADAVRDAAAQLLGLADDAAVMVQPMVSGTEVIIGGFRDPQFGPVVAVGLGGILVEVLADVAFRLAPLTPPQAQAALRSLRGFAVLEGVRGAAGVDLDALAETVAAASRLLAAVPEISELDLNPIIARPDGAVAVDLRVIGAGATRRNAETDLLARS